MLSSAHERATKADTRGMMTVETAASGEAASSSGFTQGNRSSVSIRVEYAANAEGRHGITLKAGASFSAAPPAASAAVQSGEAVVGSSALYQAIHAQGSPFRVPVHHRPIKSFEMSGDAVSLMTAGIEGSFSLFIRDDFNNRIVTMPDIFTVQNAYPAYPSILSGALLNGSNSSTLFVPYESMPVNALANHSIFIGGKSRAIRSSASSTYPHAIAGAAPQRHIRIHLAAALPFVPSPGDPFEVRLLDGLPTQYASVIRSASHFQGTITVTRASAMTLFSQAARAGGLSASYYSNSDLLGAPAISRADADIDFSGLSDADWPGRVAMNTSSAEREFSVRWQGFILPHYPQTYTFRATLHDYLGTSRQERTRLWINNEEVIMQWTSLSSSLPSGTFAFTRAAGGGHYSEQPFVVEAHFKDSEAGGRYLISLLPGFGFIFTYQPHCCSPCISSSLKPLCFRGKGRHADCNAPTLGRRFKLEWETSEFARLHSRSTIHDQRLFMPIDLDSSPYSVTVRPSTVVAANTSFFGSYQGLLRGVEDRAAARFNTSLVIRDTYGNVRQAVCPEAAVDLPCEDALRLTLTSATTGRQVAWGVGACVARNRGFGVTK